MGFVEKTVDDPECDTIFMQENVMQLPEVVVESRRKKLLHILAYVREYSTLATYTDTVSMFREKMVDFMMPDDDKVSFKGWTYPRVLNSKSYYHFTDANGLDSVSDRCSHHFTWSDWIGMPPELALPQKIIGKESASDTVFGKYGPAQIWLRTGERLTLDVRFLADTASRKLIPRFSSFFHNDDIDFEQFGLRINYSNVFGSSAGPFELAGYSFNIESRGRGHDIFMFNHRDEPLFVTTYTEVYILDKEFVTVKEAKKWDKRNFGNASIDIYEPMEAPALQPSVLALIDRVNNIDADIVRQALPTDQRLVSRKVSKHNFNIANRALTLLKELTGISSYRSKKNFDRHWNDFTKDQIKKNQESRKQRSDE